MRTDFSNTGRRCQGRNCPAFRPVIDVQLAIRAFSTWPSRADLRHEGPTWLASVSPIYAPGPGAALKLGRSAQIEYVPVPPPLELDPLAVPEPLPDELENDDPLDLLPDPLLEPLDEPDVDPDPEADAVPDPDAEPLPLVCAVASATPLVASSAGRSLCVQTPSAE